MNDQVFLNGKFVERSKALIPADDRGFQFADGVYEVIKYYNGFPFRFEDHLERLKYSLDQLKLNYENLSELREIFGHLLLLNNLESSDSGIYLQITRGVHSRVHHFPPITERTIYAYAFPFPSFRENLRKGISAITSEDIRWLRCDIKSVSLLPNTLLFQKARESGAGECILIRNGMVTEATHSSVAGIKNGMVITHPLSNLILPGITRKITAEICKEYNITIDERAIHEGELTGMDELFICGTGSEITPVISVNGHPIGPGKPGPVTCFLQDKLFRMAYSASPDQEQWWNRN